MKLGPSTTLVGSMRRRLTLSVATTVTVLAGLVAPAFSGAAADSQGTDFWLAFTQNYFGTVQKTLFITGPQAASGTVEIPGIAFSQAFTVTPGAVTSVPLPNNSDITASEGVEHKGIHVTADHEVGVYGLSRQQYTTDAYLGLPTDVLGTDYIVLGYGPGLSSEFGVAATQDTTKVTITPSVAGTGGRAAGVPYDVTLNKGDVYQLHAQSPPQDLTGTLISSDKPIAVYGGNQCANVPQGYSACDYIVEEMPPTSTWGTNFLTVPLKTRTKGDTFRFLASNDGTDVSVNGSVVATLNRGQVFEQIITGQSTVTSTKPILVGQYSNGSSYDGVTSDPFEMLLPPTEQFADHYTVTTPASGFRANFINLVVPDPDVGNVAIDGTPVAPGAFTPIGSTGFSGSQNDVSLGTHNLTGTRPFGAYMYGFDSYDSYGYPGGQSFAPIANVATLTLTPATGTYDVGTTQCVDAKLFDANGSPVPDVRVDFEITGANPAAPFSKNADANGNAQVCYQGTNLGDDTITATQGKLKATATKSWTEPKVVPAPPAPPAPVPLAEGCGLSIDGVDLLGDAGKNALSGTEKTDRLRGSGNADTLSGAGAADCLRGDEGADIIHGDDGNDIIRGGADDDNIHGDAGADDIRLQNGQDKVDGGPGDDSIKAQGRGSDTVKCGDGNDHVIADVKDTVAADCEHVKIVNPHKA